MSCGRNHRCGSDPTLLWLWQRPAASAAIRPLALELPYAADVTLKKQNKKKVIKGSEEQGGCGQDGRLLRP